ncbi:MAG: hypothetical protein WCG80_15780 [Spirochaetales bacterium]
MHDLIELRSGDLCVEIAPPGSDYTASRFDWTTGVRQLTWKGHKYLTAENLGLPGPEGQGWGLSGEFGIQTPVGYDECPAGEWFPKLGIGLLQRSDARPYHFFRPYAVRPARFEIHEEPGSVRLAAVQDEHRGWAWRLERHWSVEGNRLTLVTYLCNTGRHRLTTEEYIHNFLALEPGYRLEVPVELESEPLAEKVDPEQLLSVRGSRVEWKQRAAQDFFFSRTALPAPRHWTLRDPQAGTWLREDVTFEPTKFNLWGRGHVVSPELFWAVDLAQGDELVSTRVWSVGQD